MLLSTSVKRIPSLDGLRAISISLVIVGHSWASSLRPSRLDRHLSLLKHRRADIFCYFRISDNHDFAERAWPDGDNQPSRVLSTTRLQNFFRCLRLCSGHTDLFLA